MDQQSAAGLLADIAGARRRTAVLRHYRQTGSVTTAWGLAWLAGFGATQFMPASSGLVWTLGWAGALLWTFTRPHGGADRQASLTWLAGVGFAILLLLMIGADERTGAAVFAQAVAAGFTILGIWSGRRFIVLGLAVALTASIGWWLMPDWLFLALGLSGGGALIAGGQWLRHP